MEAGIWKWPMQSWHLSSPSFHSFLQCGARNKFAHFKSEENEFFYHCQFCKHYGVWATACLLSCFSIVIIMINLSQVTQGKRAVLFIFWPLLCLDSLTRVKCWPRKVVDSSNCRLQYFRKNALSVVVLDFFEKWRSRGFIRLLLFISGWTEEQISRLSLLTRQTNLNSEVRTLLRCSEEMKDELCWQWRFWF